MTGRTVRLASVAVMIGCLSVGCRSDREPTSADQVPTATSAAPDRLVGLWRAEVDGAWSVLRFAPRALRVWEECGSSDGTWLTQVESLDIGVAASPCDSSSSWLTRVERAEVMPSGSLALIVRDRGPVTLTPATPGSRPGPPVDEVGTVPRAGREPRDGSDAVVALPEGLVAASESQILGEWTLRPGSRLLGQAEPVDGRASGDSRLTFGPNGAAGGTDGCNPWGGAWAMVGDGLISVRPGGTTLAYCGPFFTDTAAAGAVRAGFDGDVLVLIDEAGERVGEFVRVPEPGRSGSSAG